MSEQALALVLTAAVLHAVWNLAAKRVELDGVAFVWLYVVGSVVIWGPVAVVWVVVQRRAARLGVAVRRGADRGVPHRLPARAPARLREGRPQPGLPAGPRDRTVADVRVRGRRAGGAPRCRGGRGRPRGRRRHPAHLARRSARTGFEAGRGASGASATGVGHRGVHALGQPRRQRPRRTAAAVLRRRAGAAAAGDDAAARTATRHGAGRVARGARAGDRGGRALADGLRAGAAGDAARPGLPRRACPGEQHRGRRAAQLVAAEGAERRRVGSSVRSSCSSASSGSWPARTR